MSFWNEYETERTKLGCLPDADADFIALANTAEKYPKEYVEVLTEVTP